MLFTFSSGELGWTLDGGAVYAKDFHSPDRAVAITGSGTSTYGGAASRVLSLIPGAGYILRAWVKGGDASPTTPLVFLIDGTAGEGVPEFLGRVYQSGLDSGKWRFVEFDPFVAQNAAPVFRAMLNNGAIGGDVPSPGPIPISVPATGRWVFDDIEIAEVSEMAMSKWSAISAAINVVKGINGVAGTYNHDLGSRVYTRYFTPEERPQVKLPYAVFALSQEAEVITYPTENTFESSWAMSGRAFFDDNVDSDPLNSTGATAAAKFRNDLIRAFMLNPKLSKTVLNAEVTNIETWAGVSDDGVAEVIFRVAFTQYGSAADLSA